MNSLASPHSIRVLGHRGARHAAEENTLAAFELARQQGAAGTELDVQASADGRIYVVHDLNLARVTEGQDRRVVRRLSSSQLDAVRLRGGHAIPRLEQVLDWADQHELFLNIELKTRAARTDPIATLVAQLLLERRTPPERVLVSSFHPLLLRRFAQRLPDVPTGWLFSQQHGCLGNVTWPRLLGCKAIHPPAALLLKQPELLSRWHGFEINTWTVNDPADAQRLAAMGVHSLISDCPDKILAALSQPV